MRTYDPTQLIPHDPTSLAWALAWARRFAGDVPPWRPGSQEDEEWQAWLTATALVVNDTTYYRPHEAAARALEADPNRLRALNLAGVTQQYREPHEAAAAIRRGGAWVDELIGAATGRMPGELGVVF